MMASPDARLHAADARLASPDARLQAQAMSHTPHRLAHTTPKTRAERRALCEAGLTPHGPMRRDSVGPATIVKWQRREDVEGRSHRAHTRHTGLCAAQAPIVVELRRLLAWPLDEPRAVTRRFIDPDESRSGLKRFLQREGLGRPRALRAARANEKEGKEEKDRP
jgi:hypothetical protein